MTNRHHLPDDGGIAGKRRSPQVVSNRDRRRSTRHITGVKGASERRDHSEDREEVRRHLGFPNVARLVRSVGPEVRHVPEGSVDAVGLGQRLKVNQIDRPRPFRIQLGWRPHDKELIGLPNWQRLQQQSVDDGKCADADRQAHAEDRHHGEAASQPSGRPDQRTNRFAGVAPEVLDGRHAASIPIGANRGRDGPERPGHFAASLLVGSPGSPVLLFEHLAMDLQLFQYVGVGSPPTEEARQSQHQGPQAPHRLSLSARNCARISVVVSHWRTSRVRHPRPARVNR